MDIKVKVNTLLELLRTEQRSTFPQALQFKERAPNRWYDGVPEYLVDIYDWAYVNPKWVAWLDQNMVVRVLLFGNDARLMRIYLDEIQPGMKVWQVAHVYGDLVQRVAARVGPLGRFHLTDITPIQIEHGCNKLAAFPWARVIRANAATYDSGADYDLICSFFLLHEVPEEKKYQIVDHLLECVPPGGKALFIDYHRPAWWQPVRWILKGVNAWLEPFADALWQHEIQDYASCPKAFTWCKRTFFGGTYQVVRAVRNS
ncbi:rhodoquinone biosynthesis methyltransferase RquA (plasmid) [Dechloromonas sp. ARDL1]|uniref:rhodoquinone biosynthesis methyltransferase RquA n=1 Tax=Dechloromonas sp. ARDL1 TaxID=3322121 RepID=UPI003DA73E92